MINVFIQPQRFRYLVIQTWTSQKKNETKKQQESTDALQYFAIFTWSVGKKICWNDSF